MISPSSFALFGLLVTWMTPIWLLSLGVAIGVLILAIAYGVTFLVSRRVADVLVASVREGILLPIFYLAMFLTVFSVLGVFLVPGIPYRQLLTSVSRISAVGPSSYEIVIPPATADYSLEAFKVPLAELRSFSAESDQPVSMITNIQTSVGQPLAVKIMPGAPADWVHSMMPDRAKLPLPITDLTNWKATNVGSSPATIRLHAVTNIEFPEVWVVPATALAVVGLVLGYLALRLCFPKIAAIAVTTAKDSMSQPLFYVVLLGGSFALLAFIFIPYNTFGEDVKMLKSSGMTFIMVLSMLVAVWSASVSVSEEVEGRTALTVLSKPVLRRQFIFGKFLGILGPVVVLFVVLGFLFLVTVSFKVVYDSREVAKSEPAWQLCQLEMMQIIPGLVLAFFETIVLSAISVAMSTRLSMLANLIVCASIYALGHLVPMLVQSSVGRFEIVRFAGQFLATVLPVLDVFNVQPAVAAGHIVPLSYLGVALIYCLLYSAIAMLLGLAMFEDRDLA